MNSSGGLGCVCGRELKSLAGLTMHMGRCVRARQHRIRTRRDCQEAVRRLRAGENTMREPRWTPEAGFRDRDRAPTSDSSSESTDDEDQNEWGFAVPVASALDEEEPQHPLEPASRYSNGGTERGSSRGSTTIVTRRVTFEQVTGRKAGTAIPGPASGRETRSDNMYYPFVDEANYAFAKWMYDARIPKGAVDRFFDDERLEGFIPSLQFGSADEWHQLLDAVEGGVSGNTWEESLVYIPAASTGGGRTADAFAGSLLKQDVLEVVKFMLRFEPFSAYMSYAPTRSMRMTTNSDGRQHEVRMYTGLHDCDWWWDTQLKLPEGSTVVPVMIGVDETQLTQHRGDQTAWPVYVSIGNLDARVRRSRKAPGNMLVAMLPVIKHHDKDLKASIYHQAMGKVLEHGNSRMCYPIVCGIMADYKEQVLLTGVKNNQHCTVCKIAPKMRDTMVFPDRPDKSSSEYAGHRTHNDTISKIRRIREQRVRSSDPEYVHQIENFAWRFPHVNVHTALMPDLLHQLHTGVMGDSVKWLSALLDDMYGRSQADYNSSGVSRLDKRYREVPHYPRLIRFNKIPVSKISQWTGNERKALARQILAIFAPLLSSKPNVVRYLRAMCDFVMIAHYHSQDEETLAYLLNALERIDTYKWELINQRRGPQSRHFRIPKFHAITHYIWMIRQYGPLPNCDPATYTEAPHSYLVKAWFKLTNHRRTLQQIAVLNAQ
ncbi:unnamed protein product [Periconia digitata]|uniref:Uncharacterized protein n=1 Tax=Periconia digitata TaxID=1303443 RepID=A0A9W4U2D7_9PLEO|nr:unnamed protein product [Periconia digitata]